MQMSKQNIFSDFSDLKNKNILVIGGFGLIGKAVCEGFAAVGSNLYIGSRNKDSEFLKKLSRHGKTTYLKIDITSSKDIDKAIKTILGKAKSIDVFVNATWPRAAGLGETVESVSYDSIKENLIEQLGSYYNCTQRIAMQMKKQKHGSIINFSSIYGIVAPTFSIYKGTNMTSPVAYALIKGGLNGLTRYFASYFGKYNVRVNSISPGGIYRNENIKFVRNYKKLTPLGRIGMPEDLIMPTLFLASEGSKYITGHNLLVDGGWTIH